MSKEIPQNINSTQPRKKDAISFFASHYTKKIQQIKENPDLAQYFIMIYAIIMLGFKEQYPDAETNGAMRFKSDYSSELKFIENMTEEDKNGIITQNADGSYSISCLPPTDIVAGKIVIKPNSDSYPNFEDQECMSIMHEELDEPQLLYKKAQEFYDTKYKPSKPFQKKHPDFKYRIHLGVPLLEYIDTAINLLDKTLEILEFNQSRISFKRNRQIILANLDTIKKSFYQSKKELQPNLTPEIVDSFFDFITTCTYEEYMGYLDSKKNPAPKTKFRIANTALLESVQDQRKRYVELRQKIEANPQLYDPELNPQNQTNQDIEINKFIENNPDLDFNKLYKSYQAIFSDRYVMTASRLQFSELFNTNTMSGKLLHALGVKHSDKKSKISAKENGFLSSFEYIDTPLGTMEIRIETQMRQEIQTTGSAAHADANKAPLSISFEESRDPESVLEELKYAVPRTVYFKFDQLDPTRFLVHATTNGLVTSYLNICSEFNTEDPKNAVRADNLRLLKRKARAYQSKHFPNDNDTSEKISYSTVLSTISALLEKHGKIYGNFHKDNELQMDVIHNAITDYIDYIKSISKDCAIPCSNQKIEFVVPSDELFEYWKKQQSQVTTSNNFPPESTSPQTPSDIDPFSEFGL
ncbi:MAG: hypothetical protein IKN09_03505 [Clostridia bacterium]|nr:hypothetical protein [Clostridia bacterium]